MDINKLKELAFSLMAKRKAHLGREKGFIYHHGVRVSTLAIKLREIILPEDNSHDDIIIAASLFHDIAKGIEPHGRYGSVLVKDVLAENCTEDEINKISEIIYYHPLRKKENNYSEYIKIVQDADILDHFGSIEIWMNFQYNSYKDKSLHDSLDFYKNQFDEQAKNYRQSLNYEVSRRIFQEKTDFVHSFVKRMEIEANGGFYCIP